MLRNSQKPPHRRRRRVCFRMVILGAILVLADRSQAQVYPGTPTPALAFPGDRFAIVEGEIEVIATRSGSRVLRRVRTVAVLEVSTLTPEWGFSLAEPSRLHSPVPGFTVPLILNADGLSVRLIPRNGGIEGIPPALDQRERVVGNSAWTVRMEPAVGTTVEIAQQFAPTRRRR